MVSGHPWSAGGLHITLTPHVNDFVSLMFITGGDGTSVVENNRSEMTEFKWSVNECIFWKWRA